MLQTVESVRIPEDFLLSSPHPVCIRSLEMSPILNQVILLVRHVIHTNNLSYSQCQMFSPAFSVGLQSYPLATSTHTSRARSPSSPQKVQSRQEELKERARLLLEQARRDAAMKAGSKHAGNSALPRAPSATDVSLLGGGGVLEGEGADCVLWMFCMSQKSDMVCSFVCVCVCACVCVCVVECVGEHL